MYISVPFGVIFSFLGGMMASVPFGVILKSSVGIWVGP